MALRTGFLLLGVFSSLRQTNSQCPILANLYIGWTKIGSGYYKVVDSGMSFSEAQQYCSDRGGQLPVIYNQDVYDALNSIIGGEERYIYITNPYGMDCNPNCSGKRIWNDGFSLTYRSWFQYEFDINSESVCATMKSDLKIKGSKSSDCGHDQKSWCQFKCSCPALATRIGVSSQQTSDPNFSK